MGNGRCQKQNWSNHINGKLAETNTEILWDTKGNWEGHKNGPLGLALNFLFDSDFSSEVQKLEWKKPKSCTQELMAHL